MDPGVKPAGDDFGCRVAESIDRHPLQRAVSPKAADSRQPPELVSLLITTKKQPLLYADINMPGTPFGPGTFREFQFPE
jgi:hypothetical protein